MSSRQQEKNKTKVNHKDLIIVTAPITVGMKEETPMSKAFAAYFGLFQLLLIALYFAFVEYDDYTDPATKPANQMGAEEVSSIYGMWQDIHIMIFIGFAFLMTFLQSYGFSALTINFMVGALAIQWGILCVGFWHSLWEADGVIADMHRIPLRISQLLEGDFAAAASLISLGAMLGKATPTQVLIMVCIELIFYAFNYQLSINEMGAADVGGTLSIHVFGAYFGLACSMVMSHDSIPGARRSQEIKDHKLNTSLYHGDMFSMVGTLFLWCFWPSFVAVLASGNARDRAVVHTVLAISASCLSALVCSSIWRPLHKFNMVDVQNATLAGGVTIGAIADHYLAGGGAMLAGACAGILSTAGYCFVQPFLEDKIGLFDTCGVHNLHGMPGILGGLASVLTASMAGKSSRYGDNVSDVFSKMDMDGGRSASSQAMHQLYALGITLGIALGSGALAGLICKQPALCDSPSEYFSDITSFEVPEDFPVDNNVDSNEHETSDSVPEENL